MKNNGKMTAAFLVVGLLGLIAGAGGIVLIYLAGDFDRYYTTYPYQYYIMAVTAVAVLAFLLACCFAGGLSSSNKTAHKKLTGNIKAVEEAQAAAEHKAAEAAAAQAAAEQKAREAAAALTAAERKAAEAERKAEAAAERAARAENPVSPAAEQNTAPEVKITLPVTVPVATAEAEAALERIKSDALELKTLVEKSASPAMETPDAGGETAGKPKMESLIDGIDDIAFRAHLLSLNVAIETSNAGDPDGSLSSIADDVRAIENKSAAIASECKAVFTAEPRAAKEAPAGSVLAPEMTAVIERIIAAAEGTRGPQPVSPIDPSVGGGLFS